MRRKGRYVERNRAARAYAYYAFACANEDRFRISIVKITENTTWIQRRRFRIIVLKTSANIKQKGRGRYIKGIDKAGILWYNIFIKE